MNNEIKRTIETIGDVFQWLIPVIALMLCFNANDMNLITTFFWLFITTNGITSLVKLLTFAPRPRKNIGDDIIWKWSPGFNSFPSGHTTSAMTGAWFILLNFQNWYFVIPALIAGLFTGYSRVVAKAHYWRDVVVAITMTLIASLIFNYVIFK